VAGRRRNVPVSIRDIPIEEKRAPLRGAFVEALRPKEYLDLDQWSDRYRRLPSETSSEPGEWSTDRFPFLREIMRCLSPSSRARHVVAIKGA